MGGSCCRSTGTGGVDQPHPLTVRPRQGRVGEDGTLSLHGPSVVPQSLQYPERTALSLFSTSPLEFVTHPHGTTPVLPALLPAQPRPLPNRRPVGGQSAVVTNAPNTIRPFLNTTNGNMIGTNSARAAHGPKKNGLFPAAVDGSDKSGLSQTLSNSDTAQRTIAGQSLSERAKLEVMRQLEALKRSVTLLDEIQSNPAADSVTLLEECLQIRRIELGVDHAATGEIEYALGIWLSRHLSSNRPSSSSSALTHLKEAARIYHLQKDDRRCVEIFTEIADIHGLANQTVEQAAAQQAARDSLARIHDSDAAQSPPSLGATMIQSDSLVSSTPASSCHEEIARLCARLGDLAQEFQWRRAAMAKTAAYSANADGLVSNQPKTAWSSPTSASSSSKSTALATHDSASSPSPPVDEASVHAYEVALSSTPALATSAIPTNASSPPVVDLAQELAHEQLVKSLAVKAFGPQSLRVADHSYNCGSVLLQLGRPLEALQSFKDALDIFEATHARNSILASSTAFTPDSTEYATLISLLNTLTKLGDVHGELGEMHTPQEWLVRRRAYALTKAHTQLPPIHLATKAYALGVILQKLQHHTDAIAIFKDALQAFTALRFLEPTSENKHKELHTLSRLIEIYAEVGDSCLTEELSCAKLALSIERDLYGVDDVQLGASHYNLALTHLRARQYHLALKAFLESVRISRKHHEHAEAAEALLRASEIFAIPKNGGEDGNEGDEDLNDLHRMLALKVEALEELKEACRANQQPIDKSEQIALESLHIAALHVQLNQHASSIPFFQQASAIHIELGEFLRSAHALNSIGTSYGILGDLVQKLSYRLLALEQLKRGSPNPKEDLTLADQYFNLAWIYKKQQSYHKALKFYQEAKLIYKRVHGSSHTRTVAVSQQIDHCSSQLKQDQVDDRCSHLITKKDVPTPPSSPMNGTSPTSSGEMDCPRAITLQRTRPLPQCPGSVILSQSLIQLPDSRTRLLYYEVKILDLTPPPKEGSKVGQRAALTKKVSVTPSGGSFLSENDAFEGGHLRHHDSSGTNAQAPPTITIGFAHAKYSVSRLPGSDEFSIGFGSDGLLYLNDEGIDYSMSWSIGDILGCALDLDRRRIFFTHNGLKLGAIPIDIVAHSPYFACVGFGASSTPHDHVQLEFGPPSLFRYQVDARADEREQSLSTRTKLPHLLIMQSSHDTRDGERSRTRIRSKLPSMNFNNEPERSEVAQMSYLRSMKSSISHKVEQSISRSRSRSISQR